MFYCHYAKSTTELFAVPFSEKETRKRKESKTVSKLEYWMGLFVV